MKKMSLLFGILLMSTMQVLSKSDNTTIFNETFYTDNHTCNIKVVQAKGAYSITNEYVPLAGGDTNKVKHQLGKLVDHSTIVSFLKTYPIGDIFSNAKATKIANRINRTIITNEVEVKVNARNQTLGTVVDSIESEINKTKYAGIFRYNKEAYPNDTVMIFNDYDTSAKEVFKIESIRIQTDYLRIYDIRIIGWIVKKNDINKKIKRATFSNNVSSITLRNLNERWIRLNESHHFHTVKNKRQIPLKGLITFEPKGKSFSYMVSNNDYVINAKDSTKSYSANVIRKRLTDYLSLQIFLDPLGFMSDRPNGFAQFEGSVVIPLDRRTHDSNPRKYKVEKDTNSCPCRHNTDNQKGSFQGLVLTSSELSPFPLAEESKSQMRSITNRFSTMKSQGKCMKHKYKYSKSKKVVRCGKHTCKQKHGKWICKYPKKIYNGSFASQVSTSLAYVYANSVNQSPRFTQSFLSSSSITSSDTNIALVVNADSTIGSDTNVINEYAKDYKINNLDYIRNYFYLFNTRLHLYTLELKAWNSWLHLSTGVKLWGSRIGPHQDSLLTFHRFFWEFANLGLEIRPDKPFGMNLNIGIGKLNRFISGNSANTHLKNNTLSFAYAKSTVIPHEVNFYYKLSNVNNGGLYFRYAGYLSFNKNSTLGKYNLNHPKFLKKYSLDFFPTVLVGYATNISTLIKGEFNKK